MHISIILSCFLSHFQIFIWRKQCLLHYTFFFKRSLSQADIDGRLRWLIALNLLTINPSNSTQSCQIRVGSMHACFQMMQQPTSPVIASVIGNCLDVSSWCITNDTHHIHKQASYVLFYVVGKKKEDRVHHLLFYLYKQGKKMTLIAIFVYDIIWICLVSGVLSSIQIRGYNMLLLILY